MSNSLFLTKDGSHSLFSSKFGVSYHSKYGAIQETQHVFINAALRLKALHQSDIHIMDIGFGTGLNAYMTLLAAGNRNLRIHYTAIEAFPIPYEMAELLNYSELLNTPALHELFLSMHKAPWSQLISFREDFQFIKHPIRFEEIEFSDQFDIIYFDAFAPNSQPELWDELVLEKMYKALKTEGILVTYCAKGVVKRTLKKIGFEVESLKGPPGKREMTRAIKT